MRIRCLRAFGPGRPSRKLHSASGDRPFSVQPRRLGIELLEDRRLLSVDPFPLPLEGAVPLGSLVYESTAAVEISVPGETHGYTIELDDGQTITMVADPDATLQPTVGLFDAGGASLGTASATAAGEAAVLQTAPTTGLGTYTATIGGAAATAGSGTVRLILNAAVELEEYGGPANDQMPSAQDFDAGFAPLPGGVGRRAAMLGALPSGSEVGQDFESGELGPQWSISSSTEQGRIRVTDQYSAAGGSYALMMDVGSQDRYNLNEAIWTVDLSPLSQPILCFSHAQWRDEIDPFAGDFTGSYPADGIAVSDDGVNWHPVWDVPNHSAGTWRPHLIDLAEEAAQAGITLGRDFRIKFQQYDNYPLDVDGRGYDEIMVTTAAAAEDWYRFCLDDAETATLALTARPRGTVDFELFDEAGNRLAVGAGASYVDRAIRGFLDVTTDGLPNAYFVRVAGLEGVAYNLVATRGADFETEVNRHSSVAQRLHGTDGVLGYVDGALGYGGNWYSIEVNAGDELLLQTFTPADGPGQWGNLLDLSVVLFDPVGGLSYDNSGAPDGRNALLRHTATVTGTHNICIVAERSTAGECLLSVRGATGEFPVFEVTGTDPPHGALLEDAPRRITVDFNHGIHLQSLDPSDLTVDGLAATGVAAVDHDTAVFDLPELEEGFHDVAIAPGAVRDLQGTSIRAYAGRFVFDRAAPRVISSSLLEGQIVGIPPHGGLAVTVEFDEELDAAHLAPGDVRLIGTWHGPLAPEGFQYDPDASVLRMEYAGLAEDYYRLSLLSGNGRFEDRAGRDLDGEPHPHTTVPSGDGTAGGDFVVHFSTDLASVMPFPTPLLPKAPPGSLIYHSDGEASIVRPDDVDRFAVELDGLQTVAVVVEGDALLQPSVELFDPGGASLGRAAAAAAGERAVLQVAAATGAGTYTMQIAGAAGTTGLYTARLTLNAAVEEEEHGGPANDDPASAEGLEASFLTIGGGPAQRGALLGAIHDDYDWYRFTLADGQSATLLATSSESDDLTLGLYDRNLNLTAVGTSADNADQVIDRFVDPTTDGGGDVYYAQVHGRGSYSLVVTRGAGFDVEPNNGPGPNVQETAAGGTTLGHLGLGPGETVTQRQRLAPADGRPGDCFAEVAVSGDVAVVGADAKDDLGGGSGSAYIFRLQYGRWTEREKLVATDAGPGDLFGLSVSVDGNTAIVGAPGAEPGGSAYVFQFDGNRWVQQQKLVPSRVYSHAGFGSSVSIGGGIAVVGSPGDSNGPERSGAVYLFRFDGSQWVEEERIVGHYHNAHFGSSVCVSGATIVVGAPGDPAAGRESQAHVYRHDGILWRRQQSLYGSNSNAYDRFGDSVFIEEDAIIVGASGDDGNGGGSGSAYVFRRRNTRWSRQQKLEPAHGNEHDAFGARVSLHGQLAVVGAPGFDGAGIDSGTAYLFRFDGSRWTETQQLTASDGGPDDRFGEGIALGGKAILVGARRDDNGSNPGAVYVFQPPPFDDYLASVRAGNALVVSTTTPGDGAGEFDNWLDPMVELLDPAGTVVAGDDNGGPDGRNSLLRHVAAFTGTYTVRIRPAAGSRGEYVLNLAGHTGPPPAFEVRAVDPAHGAVLSANPQRIVIDFNDTLLLSTLDASDFTIDGLPAAAMAVVDGDTVAVDSPGGLGVGTHRLAIGGGAVSDLQATPIESFSAEFTVVPTVAGRYLFYDNSAFDGNDPLLPTADDRAIAVDKRALMPGQTARFVNYTSFSRGINGLMVDVTGLADADAVDDNDFRFQVGNHDDPNGWAAAPQPGGIGVRPGEGVDGSDRITITWPDNAIRKQWLQVTVLPTPHTGLPEADVFYFGNAIGESGNSPSDARVTVADVLAARDNRRSVLDPAPIDFPCDYNRDGRVNAVDMLIARNNMALFPYALRLITPPLATEKTGPDAPPAAWLHELEPACARQTPWNVAGSAKRAVDRVVEVYWYD